MVGRGARPDPHAHVACSPAAAGQSVVAVDDDAGLVLLGARTVRLREKDRTAKVGRPDRLLERVGRVAALLRGDHTARRVDGEVFTLALQRIVGGGARVAPGAGRAARPGFGLTVRCPGGLAAARIAGEGTRLAGPCLADGRVRWAGPYDDCRIGRRPLGRPPLAGVAPSLRGAASLPTRAASRGSSGVSSDSMPRRVGSPPQPQIVRRASERCVNERLVCKSSRCLERTTSEPPWSRQSLVGVRARRRRTQGVCLLFSTSRVPIRTKRRRGCSCLARMCEELHVRDATNPYLADSRVARTRVRR